MRNAYARYKVSSLVDLGDCYKSLSSRKIKAFEYCEKLCAELGGWDLRIIGYNTMVFSVGFEYPDTDTGVVCFAYITRDYDRFCELDWDY